MAPLDGNAQELVQLAADAATKGGTAQGAFAMKELAKLAKDLSHSSLQLRLAEMTLHAKGCVQSLVTFISPEDPQLAKDAAWALSQLLQRCASASAWALEAGGLQAVQRCLARRVSQDILELFAWLAFGIGGSKGLLELLEANTGSGQVAQLAWVIFAQRSWKDAHGAEAPHCWELLRLLMSHLDLALQRRDEEVIHAAVATLQRMAEDLPSVAIHLVGAPNCGRIFVQVLQGLGCDTKPRISTCACLARLLQAMASCGRCQARDLLRQHGAHQALQAMAQAEGALGEAACGALAHLLEPRELSPALSALARAELRLGRAPRVRSFLEVLPGIFETELEEMHVVRELMGVLLQLNPFLQAEKLRRCRAAAFLATCAGARALVPRVEPGLWEELDASVQLIVQELQRVDFRGDSAGYGPSFEAVVDELGKVAQGSPGWRLRLQQMQLLEQISARLPQARGNKRAAKYCVWLAAALQGLPFLVQELQRNLDSENTVDACFCTIVDVLDEDVEGDWFLAHQHREVSQLRNEQRALLELVVRAMERHQDEYFIQSRGCHCLALLERYTGLVQLQQPKELLPRLLEVCVRALQQGKSNLVRDSSFLLRTMLERSSWEAPKPEEDGGAAVPGPGTPASRRDGDAASAAARVRGGRESQRPVGVRARVHCAAGGRRRGAGAPGAAGIAHGQGRVPQGAFRDRQG
ncbi:unnamed protein product [Effrenium voratum]|nr:unnamed protein product [Effrenium voratum]